MYLRYVQSPVSVLTYLPQIHLIAGVAERLPFSLDDASRAESESDVQFNKVNLDTRLNNRVLDLRVSINNMLFLCSPPHKLQTPANQAIFS